MKRLATVLVTLLLVACSNPAKSKQEAIEALEIPPPNDLTALTSSLGVALEAVQKYDATPGSSKETTNQLLKVSGTYTAFVDLLNCEGEWIARGKTNLELKEACDREQMKKMREAHPNTKSYVDLLETQYGSAGWNVDKEKVRDLLWEEAGQELAAVK